MANTKESVFYPSRGFSKSAHIVDMDQYRDLYARSLDDPETFWRELTDEFEWHKPWTVLRKWDPPYCRWFEDGELNITVNCLDRHVASGKGDKIAYHWEGEPGDRRSITYRELLSSVCQTANGLKSLGLEKGDRVIIYMPMVVETVVAMLACARLGLVHSVIFGGFSSDAIRDRVLDASARCVLTSDGGWRRGKVIPLKSNVDQAISNDACPSVEHVVVLNRCANAVDMIPDRDVWWHDLVRGQSSTCEPVMVPAEHPLYILYTSGTTGKPKGVVHATAGYMVYTAITSKMVFDLRDEDIYWCTADVGWVTGHSYIVYGILANCSSSVMYEGAPDHPDFGRFWKIVQDYKVTVFYTAPTAIRAFIKWGDAWPNKYDLSSLRLIGTVGEPINPDVWDWYRRIIGGSRCPIVDTWWQTETGGLMITPMPGATPTKPGSATLPFFGVDAEVLREDGSVADDDERGLLVIRQPWPSMIRGIYEDGWGIPGHDGEFGEQDRFRETYFHKFPGLYLAGDAATRDSDGYFWVIGRIDDVLNVSGHRIGTAEVESALVAHEAVAEAAVIGIPDDLTGESVAAFVTLKSDYTAGDALQQALRQHVANSIGAFVRPKILRFTSSLPKTRSGKIMRRLLREVAIGGDIRGDTTTLEDIDALADLQKTEES